jgi:hypothetical protein
MSVTGCHRFPLPVWLVDSPAIYVSTKFQSFRYPSYNERFTNMSDMCFEGSRAGGQATRLLGSNQASTRVNGRWNSDASLKISGEKR